jgi:hypothetical protein
LNILLNNHYTSANKFYTFAAPCCFQHSLIVRQHNIMQNIPYLIECTLPSFSHPVPAGRMKHNASKQQRNANKHRYTPYKYDNQS